MANVKMTVRILRPRKQEKNFHDIPTSYVVIFNSGLHDVIHLCGSEYFGLNSIDFEATRRHLS
jgi:hypothetical protein